MMTTTTAAITIAAIGPHLLAAVVLEDFSCPGSMIPLLLSVLDFNELQSG